MSTGFGEGMRGVAVFVTLLLSSALGTTWVDVPGGVGPNATLPAAAAPYGEVIANSSGAISRPAPTPPVPGFLPLPLHYVYLDPGYYSVNEYPWCTRYSGFREQHLYLAGEIGRGGTIDQTALFKTHYDNAATFPNVTVKMCHTSVTSLSSTFDDNYGGRTPVWVFHQDSGFVRGGEPDVWDTVALSTPFDYNGTDNLLVEVVWQGTASGLSAYSWFSNAFAGIRRASAWNITDTLVVQANTRDRWFYNTRIGFRSYPNDVGVLDTISPIGYVGFGDSVVPRGRVANFGSQAQTNVPVFCVIYDSAAGERVYAETVYVARLDTGEACTVTFPSWVPPVEDKVYLDTMMTVLQGDQDTANEWKAGRFTVAAWGEGRLTYNDGETCSRGAYSLTSPNYTLGVRFPGPCTVGRIAVGLTGYPNDSGGPYPCTCKVRLNDGTNGMPGTEVWVRPLMLYSDGYPRDYINYIALDPPVVVTSDSFYVTWKPQKVCTPFLSADWDEPIQVGNDFGTDPNSEAFRAFRMLEEDDLNVDLVIDAYYVAPLLDGTLRKIAIPPEQLDSGTTFYPRVVVKNTGLLDRVNIEARFRITGVYGGNTIVFYAGVANTGPIQAGGTRTLTLADSVTLPAGYYTMTGITLLPYDGRTANDTLVRPLAVGLGVADVNMDPGRPWVSIAPNPLGRHATVRYSLPGVGPAALDLFDVTGRTVLSQMLAARRTGTAGLDLGHLKAGVYVARLRAAGFNATRKLIVEH